MSDVDGFDMWLFLMFIGTFIGIITDLWFIPVTLLVISTGVGGYSLYRALNAPKPAPELELTNDPEFGIFQGYVCPVWEHNRFERELDSTDFLHCDNEKCPACFEHGKCAVAECKDPGTMEWQDPGTMEWQAGHYTNPTFEWLCGGHYNVRAEDRERFKAKSKREQAAREKAEAVVQGSKAIRERSRTNNGYLIPDGVPNFAHGEYSPGMDMIVWTWTDPETGRTMALKQIPTPEVEATWHDECDRGGNIIFGDYNAPRRQSPIKIQATKEHKDFVRKELKARKRPNTGAR